MKIQAMIAFLLIFLASCEQEDSDLGVDSPMFANFEVGEKSVSRIKNRTVTLVYLQREGEEIQIKKIAPMDKKTALERMRDKKILIESIYDPKPAPYFAVFTKKINCPKRFFPRILQSSGEWIEWIMLANERKGFGVCEQEQAFYNNHKFLKYCQKSRAFFEIDYYIPLEKKKSPSVELSRLIACR